MAPKKTPKKALKSMEKRLQKPISKTKKLKKKNYHSFAIYLYKLLRSIVNQDSLAISRKSMLIMDNFVSDMLEKIASEAGRLVAQRQKTTMSSREIQTAVKLIIPGELATHANVEAMKALAKYQKSQENDSAGKPS